MENNKIDNLFKDALAEYQVQPNAALWASIEKELPTQKKYFFVGWLKYGIAAAIGGLIAVSSFLLVENRNDLQNSIAKIKHRSLIQSENKNTSTNTTHSPSENKSDTIKIATSKPIVTIDAFTHSNNNNDLMDNGASNLNQVINLNEPNTIITPHISNEILSASNKRELMEFANLFKPTLISNIENEFNKRIERRNIGNNVFIDELLKRQLYFVKGFHIGLKGEFNNTWILVTQPSSITKATSTQINYKIDAGLAYGFLAGYDFNNKFGLQVEYHLVSQIAQRYEVTSQYTIKDKTTRLKLNYNHIPLLFKFKWHPLKGVEQKPVVMDYMIGVQYGWLKSTDLSTPNIIEADYIKKQINLTEWNLVAGINYDFYLNKNLFLSMGGRATYGSNLKNLFNNNLNEKSRNVTLGIELGMHYKLPFGKK
ncbi:MAG: hypothetical protein RIQ33_609 [Bacteroidota bacterium]